MFVRLSRFEFQITRILYISIHFFFNQKYHCFTIELNICHFNHDFLFHVIAETKLSKFFQLKRKILNENGNNFAAAIFNFPRRNVAYIFTHSVRGKIVSNFELESSTLFEKYPHFSSLGPQKLSSRQWRLMFDVDSDIFLHSHMQEQHFPLSTFHVNFKGKLKSREEIFHIELNFFSLV